MKRLHTYLLSLLVLIAAGSVRAKEVPLNKAKQAAENQYHMQGRIVTGKQIGRAHV